MLVYVKSPSGFENSRLRPWQALRLTRTPSGIKPWKARADSKER
ncbi:MAG: hypothetical protein BWX47_02044 [candidate division Hyd24-12 bacterium ADurb.Bin004]|nr:MAG: hypothetical protein BWX47_02044 [candidate division Hyd24-12 bacterium ADurb.Bin004]